MYSYRERVAAVQPRVAIQRRTFGTGCAEQASQTADAPPGRDERQQQSERWFGRPPYS